MNFKIGDRVSLRKEALSLSYIAARSWYTDMSEGKTGRVIGFTQANTGKPMKLAIEFDTRVFTSKEKRSKHDNGCHNRGKLHYCWYIPPECVDILSEVPIESLLLLL